MTCTERLSFGSHYKFPLKLYQVANDETIVKWTDDGASIVVEQMEFEEYVMKYYPGFVQVKSFHNLRRLFRDYGFKFQVLRKRKPYGLKLKFHHPFFTRGSPEDIVHVRKLTRKCPTHAVDGFSNSNVSRRRYLQCMSAFESVTSKCYQYHKLQINKHSLGNSYRCKNSESTAASSSLEDDLGKVQTCVEVLSDTPKPRSQHQPQITETVHTKLTEDDMFVLAQMLAKNEMSETECWQFISRRCGKTWADKSWDATLNFLTSMVNLELSLLHHADVYHQLDIDEL